MFNLNSRFQIAGMVILLILIVDFYITPHLKMLSAKFFQLLMLATGINLTLDLITVYTVNHQSTVSAGMNRFCHQVFIASIVIILYMYFQYFVILSYEQKRYGRLFQVVAILPMLLAFAFIPFGKLYYVTTPQGSYSYGMMAFAVYLIGAAYLLGILYLTFDHKNSLTQAQRISTRLALFMWTVTLVIQILFPYLFLSGIGFVFFLLIVYISFENQKTFIDYEVGGFSRNSYNQMLSEYYEKEGTLTLLNVVLESYGTMTASLGIEVGNAAMRKMGEQIQSIFSYQVYHSGRNVFTVFLRKPLEEYQGDIDSLQKLFQNTQYQEYSPQIHMDLFDVRRFAKDKKMIYDLTEYLAHQRYNSSCRIVQMNEELNQSKHREDRITQLIEQAIAESSFEVVYQPIYWPEKKCFASAEALIRMKPDEELGYISPEEFIPIAERRGRILEIGDMVLEQVTNFWKQEQLGQYGIEYIEVNLSGIQATHKNIERRLMTIMTKSGISPKHINLEITETASVKNENQLSQNMQELRKSGFSFSMDDFGTGYSNLSQMSKTFYDLVKIDKSLLWPAFGFHTDADEEEQKRAHLLLENVVRMLHDIPTGIVAEGVETEKMASFLIEHGVEHLQGYYYARPIPKAEFLAKIVSQKS